VIAFEGRNHPYKLNLVQYPGQEVKSILPPLPKVQQPGKWVAEEVI
jgi:hypothetical protein